MLFGVVFFVTAYYIHVSWNSFQKSFHKLHGELHEILADGNMDFPSADVTTCTLISYHYQSKNHHILLLVKGYVPSIVDYLRYVDHLTLKITTTHSRNSFLVDLFNCDRKQSRKDSHLVFGNAEKVVRGQFDKALVEANLISSRSASEVLYVHDLLCLELKTDEDSVLTCTMSGKGTTLCSVTGSLESVSVPNEFESMASLLHNLDEPEDFEEVTAVMMAVKQKNGKVLAIYMFLSGYLEQDVKEKEDGMWMINTVHLKNDTLCQMICEQCVNTLGKIFHAEQLTAAINRWENKSMFFAITTSVPEYNCDGMEQLHALPLDHSRDSTVDATHNECYVVCHPYDHTMLIRIFEPHNPGKAEMQQGDQGKTTNVTLQRRPAIDRSGDGQNSAESMQNQFVNRPDAITNQKQGANQSAQDLYHSQQISTGQRGRGRGNGMGGQTTSGRRRQYNSHMTSRRDSTSYRQGQGHTHTNLEATQWQAPGATSSPKNTHCASQRSPALVSIIETYNKHISLC